MSASAELPTVFLHAFEQSCSSNLFELFAAAELLAIQPSQYHMRRVNSLVAPLHPITQKAGLALAGR